MEIKYGKPIDLRKLKKTVLSDLHSHLTKIKQIVEFLKTSKKSIPQKSCYICGESSSKEIAQIYGFSYLKCLTCNHFYTSFRYSEEDIQEFYKTNSYWSQITYANKETCLYRREDVAKPKFEYIQSFKKEKGLWIDIGSGIGDLLSVASENNWKVMGLELSDTSRKFCQDFFGIELLPFDFKEFCHHYENLTGQIDVISILGVLEHLIDPMTTLFQVRKMLKKGGLIAVQVPNGNSLTSMLQALYPHNVFRHMSPCEHFMLFSKQSLLKALESTGFEAKGMWFHGMDFYEWLNHMILSNEKVLNSDFYTHLYDNMNELQYVLDRQELSDRIICVAQAV